MHLKTLLTTVAFVFYSFNPALALPSSASSSVKDPTKDDHSESAGDRFHLTPEQFGTAGLIGIGTGTLTHLFLDRLRRQQGLGRNPPNQPPTGQSPSQPTTAQPPSEPAKELPKTPTGTGSSWWHEIVEYVQGWHKQRIHEVRAEQQAPEKKFREITTPVGRLVYLTKEEEDQLWPCVTLMRKRAGVNLQDIFVMCLWYAVTPGVTIEDLNYGDTVPPVGEQAKRYDLSDNDDNSLSRMMVGKANAFGENLKSRLLKISDAIASTGKTQKSPLLPAGIHNGALSGTLPRIQMGPRL